MYFNDLMVIEVGISSTTFCLIWISLLYAAEYSPFLGIEKGAVLQEARVFNDPQLDSRRCSQVLIFST